MSEIKIIKPSTINPVDYFNFNYVQFIFDYMIKKTNIEKTSINSFSVIKNKSDRGKKMIIIKNNFFIAKEKNELNMEVDVEYTAFMMLQKFMFKNNFSYALSYVIHEIMNNKCDYIRVATKYYKKTKKVDGNGIKRNELKPWEKQAIVDDYGRQMLDEIDKYDDFTLYPDNINYKPVINNNYNLYNIFEHKPCKKEDYEDEIQWFWTKNLFQHIFGEQYKLGIKYIKVLYEMPKQKLPILVLTSEERQTGKTTFVDYLEMLFGGNSVILNPENISNNFNGSYADKNVIIIEESKFENIQAIEKLKNLSTQKKILVNTKFIVEYSIPFYGHVIITSNDENKFSKVDDPEIRYWVRKIPSLKGKSNHNILQDLKKEIPYFLYYIYNLPKVDTSKSRMVFTEDEIKTEALLRVKKESLPSLHKDIIILLDDYCANNQGYPEIHFTAKDLKEKFYNNNNKYDINYINKILKNSIKLNKEEKTKRYTPFINNDNHIIKTNVGKPFIFKNKYYEQD